MKRKYLILVAGPKWDSHKKTLHHHQLVKLETLVASLIPFKTEHALIRTSLHLSHHIRASMISGALEIDTVKPDKRIDIDYKQENADAFIEKYFREQTIRDVEVFDLVIFVTYNDLTRDIPLYFLDDTSNLRKRGCEYCQAVVLEYTDNKFVFVQYLNIGE